jgi:septal ring factor EnvC (AmiA/AmiB activator)
MRIALCLFVAISICTADDLKSNLISTTYSLLSLEDEVYRIEDQLIKLQESEKKMSELMLARQNQLSKTIMNLRALATTNPIMVVFSTINLDDLVHSFMLMQSLGPKLARTNKAVLGLVKNLVQLRANIAELKGTLDRNSEEHTQLLKQQTILIEQKYENQSSATDYNPSKDSSSLDEVLSSILKAMNPSGHKRKENFEIMHPALGEVQHRDKGFIVKARKSAQVVSPVSGRIVFAGLLSESGHVVILKQEDFFIVIKGLGSLTCQLGEDLLRGEPLGRMPTPSSLMDNASGYIELAVELRRGVSVIDAKPYVVGLEIERNAVLSNNHDVSF